ncbi:LPS translocon maturation chaperone LptM [Roseateles microcysteis]
MNETLKHLRSKGSVGRACSTAALTLLLALAGCGQKGPLYLPSDQPAKAATAASRASAPATPAPGR